VRRFLASSDMIDDSKPRIAHRGARPFCRRRTAIGLASANDGAASVLQTESWSRPAASGHAFPWPRDRVGQRRREASSTVHRCRPGASVSARGWTSTLGISYCAKTRFSHRSSLAATPIFSVIPSLRAAEIPALCRFASARVSNPDSRRSHNQGRTQLVDMDFATPRHSTSATIER